MILIVPYSESSESSFVRIFRFVGFCRKKGTRCQKPLMCRILKRESESKTIPICLSNRDAIIRNLLDTWPDAVINCAAISSPDTVDRDKSFANVINVDGAVLLAEISAHLGARYIHVSTDMVFDGTSSLIAQPICLTQVMSMAGKSSMPKKNSLCK